eukprot:GHVT01004207.1.p1 GENE.GHVT01004207.1~~GHVT01004207.1.p1  ORF type:complete len:311 (-),score=30.06 GHVT01004207.1:953-1885(-)
MSAPNVLTGEGADGCKFEIGYDDDDDTAGCVYDFATEESLSSATVDEPSGVDRRKSSLQLPAGSTSSSSSSSSRLSLGFPLSRDVAPEWTVYPQSCYEFESSTQFTGKFFPSAAQASRRLRAFQRNGVRRSAVAVVLCHQHECVHALVLQDRESQTHVLPSFKYEPWQKPREVLKRKFLKMLQRTQLDPQEKRLLARKLRLGKYSLNLQTTPPADAHDTTPADSAPEVSLFDGSSNKPGSSEVDKELNVSLPIAVEVGEVIAQWWRVEFESQALPYLPPHVTRPHERLRVFQVSRTQYLITVTFRHPKTN